MSYLFHHFNTYTFFVVVVVVVVVIIVVVVVVVVAVAVVVVDVHLLCVVFIAPFAPSPAHCFTVICFCRDEECRLQNVLI